MTWSISLDASDQGKPAEAKQSNPIGCTNLNTSKETSFDKNVHWAYKSSIILCYAQKMPNS